MAAKDYIVSNTVEHVCKTLDIAHVPVLGYATVTKYGKDVKKLLAYADNLGPGKYWGMKEGLVFRDNKMWQRSFKVVSEQWLKATGN